METKAVQIIESVQSELDSINKEIEHFNKRLADDYVFYFSDYALLLFEYSLTKEKLTEYLNFASENPERIQEWLKYHITGIEKEIFKGNFLGCSTNVLANITHTISKQVSVYLHQLYKKHNEILAQKQEETHET